MKLCGKPGGKRGCKKLLDETLFGKDVSKKDGLNLYCLQCVRDIYLRYMDENRDRVLETQRRYRDENRDRLQEYQRRYNNENRDRLQEYHRRSYNENPLRSILRHARSRAEQKGVPFELTEETMPETPMACPNPWCGTEMVRGSSDRTSSAPSLDRIIPSIGYVPGNVMWICGRCNVLKSGATAEQHEHFARLMRDTEAKLTGLAPTHLEQAGISRRAPPSRLRLQSRLRRRLPLRGSRHQSASPARFVPRP
jgi:hypothetical protein